MSTKIFLTNVQIKKEEIQMRRWYRLTFEIQVFKIGKQIFFQNSYQKLTTTTNCIISEKCKLCGRREREKN